MRRMIQLAERLACHIGGGGTSTTSSEIPEEWKPYYTQVVQNALGAMGNLPLFGGGGGGAPGAGGGGGPRDREPEIDPVTGTAKNRRMMPGDEGGGGGGGGGAPDPNVTGDGTRIRRPTGRRRPIDPSGGGGGGGGGSAPADWWMPEGAETSWRPDQGAYAWAPAGVSGPSALENRAAAGATRLGLESGEYGRAAESYGSGSEALSGKSLKDMPALQEALSIFEESIRPSVLNQAALSGQDAGTAENVALAKAKASYLMPTIFKGLDIEQADKGRLLAAGQGFAGLAGQTDARKFGAVEAQERIGKTGRAITQAEMDAQERERQRLIGASERINLGPLASLLPAVMGSTTTTSQNKF